MNITQRTRRDRKSYLALDKPDRDIALMHLDEFLNRASLMVVGGKADQREERRAVVVMVRARVEMHLTDSLNNKKHNPSAVVGDIYRFSAELGLEHLVGGLMLASIGLIRWIRQEEFV